MTARIWNVETGECSMTLTGHTGWVNSVAFHPTKASLLASGSDDKTARIWNLETGECTLTLDSFARSVAFHLTNPSILATGCWGRTAKIWNVETGECIKTLTGHTLSLDSNVNCVAFHPTNPTLITGSEAKTAMIWNVGGAQFKTLQRRFESEFGAAHPIAVKTLAGEVYTLEDWGLCEDLKRAVCELALEALGEPSTFVLLGDLGGRGEEGGGVVQIDGKYGSDDRRRMMVPGCGFNFELTLVYLTTPAAARAAGRQLPGQRSGPVRRICSESTV